MRDWSSDVCASDLTLMALPTMLRQRYQKELATGTLAASATLGILIPPSIMLVIMADLLAISVGNLFLGAIMPGLLLSELYFLYILVVSSLKPHWAPSLSDDVGPDDAQIGRASCRERVCQYV